MKLKYYLRGLGVGIIVTAVIMGVASGSRKETLSDREIKERATELGMVEQGGSLADMEQTIESFEPAPEMTATPESTPKAMATPDSTPEAMTTPDSTPEMAATPDPTPEMAVTPDPTPEMAATPDSTPEAVAISIEIKSGEGSHTVCRKLEAEGLIASASDFDSYLYMNGYDRKLRVGSYQIPSGAKPEEIAKILTQTQ